MPFFSIVGGNSGGIPVDPPTPEVDAGSGEGSSLGRFEEIIEEFQKPEWKGRSYRELKEILEILTMIGFFD
jgi:hypothetical protein